MGRGAAAAAAAASCEPNEPERPPAPLEAHGPTSNAVLLAPVGPGRPDACEFCWLRSGAVLGGPGRPAAREFWVLPASEAVSTRA